MNHENDVRSPSLVDSNTLSYLILLSFLLYSYYIHLVIFILGLFISDEIYYSIKCSLSFTNQAISLERRWQKDALYFLYSSLLIFMNTFILRDYLCVSIYFIVFGSEKSPC